MNIIEPLCSKSYMICMLLIIACSVLFLPIFYSESGWLSMMIIPAVLFIIALYKNPKKQQLELSNKTFFNLVLFIFVVSELFYVIVAIYYPLTYKSDALVVKVQAIYAAKSWEMSPEHCHYFQMFPNNMQIMVPFAFICRIFGSWKAVEVIGATLVNISILFAGLSVRNICKSNLYSVLALIVGHFYIGIGFNTFSAYSHNYGLIFPILCIYLYTSKLPDIWRFVAVVTVAAIGNELKITTLIPFIAISILEIWSWLLNGQIRTLLGTSVFVLIVFIMMSILRQNVWSSIGFERNESVETTMPFFLAMGQSTMSGGACDPSVFLLSYDMEDCTKEERNAVFYALAMSGIKERGFLGNMKFYFRKICMTWGDGTMSALKRQYENPILQKYANLYSFPRQFVLYSIYLLMFICSFRLKNKRLLALFLSIVGVFLYQLIFESQSRYVYMFTPLMIIIAIVSLYDIINKRPIKTSLR